MAKPARSVLADVAHRGQLGRRADGGQGTVVGPAVGAFLYEQLRGWLLVSPTFSHFQLVIAGVLLLVIVLFAPGGLMGLAYRLWPRLRSLLE